MLGDLSDMVARLLTVLPQRWFAEQSPNLTAILRSVGTPWVWLYNLINYATTQGRLATATDSWLDMIAHDHFGNHLIRKVNEADASYRGRIQAALLRQAATRVAVLSELEKLTGQAPTIFEPANCLDTGAYGKLSTNPDAASCGLAYCGTGGWGSLALSFEFFVTVARPPTPGIAMLAGYGTPNGGYGVGAVSYSDLSSLPSHVTDQDIQATLSSLLPVNAVAWLWIT